MRGVEGSSLDKSADGRPGRAATPLRGGVRGAPRPDPRVRAAPHRQSRRRGRRHRRDLPDRVAAAGGHAARSAGAAVAVRRGAAGAGQPSPGRAPPVGADRPAPRRPGRRVPPGGVRRRAGADRGGVPPRCRPPTGNCSPSAPGRGSATGRSRSSSAAHATPCGCGCSAPASASPRNWPRAAPRPPPAFRTETSHEPDQPDLSRHRRGGRAHRQSRRARRPGRPDHHASRRPANTGVGAPPRTGERRAGGRRAGAGCSRRRSSRAWPSPRSSSPTWPGRAASRCRSSGRPAARRPSVGQAAGRGQPDPDRAGAVVHHVGWLDHGHRPQPARR